MWTGILISACGSAADNRALGVDSNGNLARFPATVPAQPNVTWYLGVGLDANGAPLGAYFRNKLTGGYLYGYRSIFPIPFLAVGPKTVLDPWSTWSFGAAGNSEYLAVRPVANDDFNINIIGGCNRTGIGLYPWGGGTQNERWSFFPDSSAPPQPSSYYVRSGCGGYLGMNPQTGQVIYDGGFKLAAGFPPPQYTWRVEVALAQMGQGRIYPLSGLVLINSIRPNQAVQANGAGNAVSLVDLGRVNAQSAWNTDVSSLGDKALRPLSDDGQNLNVSGGCTGTQVITYEWTGGAPNEKWYLTPA